MVAVAIIPAKGNSKRIPRKNVRPFHGLPMISYSIKAAKASGLFDFICVSTDDQEIANVGVIFGAQSVRRPLELTEDSVGTQEVAAHLLDILSQPYNLGPIEYACVIYPCAPLITPDDLREAYRHAYEHPYNYVYAEGQFYFGIAQRFIDEPSNFSYSKRMESERYIDIDTPEDWARAEEMYAALHKESA